MEQRTVSLTATIALSILTLIIGFFAGMVATNPEDASSVLSTMTESTKDKDNAAATEASNNSASANNAAPAATQSNAPNGDAVAFTLSTDMLSDSQQTMLKAMGVEDSEIAVTYDMIACAEAKIGADRVEAIKNGASPSFAEGTQLMACY